MKLLDNPITKRIAWRLAMLAVLLLCVGLLKPVNASAATLAAGDLIKLPDDGNSQTTHDSAVYYYGVDGKRYVFPNSQTYFTWYSDFSGVKTVSSTELAAVPIGGNVTYRPGTRLVKITSDPKVYAVEPGGVLRPIDSETVALSLYGANWNKIIDDVPDAFFFNYTIGNPLTAAVYPDGTVVRRSSDGAIFRIEDRAKRQISSMDVLSVLRFQDKFILTASDDLSGYPDSTAISTAELAITDTSQQNLTMVASVPTFSLVAPSSGYISIGGDATLMELKLSSVKAVRVTKLTVRIAATTGASSTPASDYDEGGLVYGNNAQPNLRKIRFVDQAAASPFGEKDLAVDVLQDQSQTLTFSGNWYLVGGQEQRLYLKAQLNDLMPAGEGYQAHLLVGQSTVLDAATGQAVSFVPTSDIAGSVLTSRNAKMTVTLSTEGGNQTVVRGAEKVTVNSFRFEATKDAPNVINSLTVQGYLDEEWTAGFLPGGDTDNGTETLVREVTPRVYLYQGTTQLAGPVNVDVSGQATFSGLALHVAAGGSVTLRIVADTNVNAQLEQVDDRVMFDITDAKQNVVVTDDHGGQVLADGELPNGGHEAVTYLTIRAHGKLELKWTGGGGVAIAGREVRLGELYYETEYDSFDLNTIAFRFATLPASLPGPFRLEYPKADGTTGTLTVDRVGNAVTFNAMPARLAASGKVYLYGTLLGRTGGAVYGEALTLSLSPNDGLQWTSVADGTDFSAADLNGDFQVSKNQATSWQVRFSTLTAAVADGSPDQIYRNYPEEVLRFSLTAAPEGPVRIKKLAFSLKPNDTGNLAQDTLEYWAQINGDTADDDGIADLYWLSSSGNKQLIGEGGNGEIDYSIVRGSTEMSSPVSQGYFSGSGDYARIVYVLNQELTIPAGTTYLMSYQIDATGFQATSDRQLEVKLLGSSDFQWTDIPVGTYTALSGADALGIPFGKTVTVKF